MVLSLHCVTKSLNPICNLVKTFSNTNDNKQHKNTNFSSQMFNHFFQVHIYLWTDSCTKRGHTRIQLNITTVISAKCMEEMTKTLIHSSNGNKYIRAEWLDFEDPSRSIKGAGASSILKRSIDTRKLKYTTFDDRDSDSFKGVRECIQSIYWSRYSVEKD